MNQYHIRIDGEQSTDSYTYQELVDMGLFELDVDGLNGIEVKKTTNSYFTPLKSFCFPEQQSNESSYYVDEYGQIHRKNKKQNNGHNNGYVDEFGQIVRSTDSTSSSSGSSGSTNTNSSSSSSLSSNSTTNSDISGRIIGTILVLVIGIPILINVGFEGFWGSVVFVVGSMIIWGIWDEYL